MSKNVVYLNGKYLPIKKATISVLDRGFLFSDGVYEVIPIYNNKLFFADQHLDRLKNSLRYLNLHSDYDKDDWRNIFQSLINKNDAQKGNYHIYLQVTRGHADKRTHKFPTEAEPTILVTLNISSSNQTYKTLSQGKSAITTVDHRWQNCHIKSISLLANVLHTNEATQADADEAILIRDGYALEGASSNLFIVKNGTIITPPLSTHILPGITRAIILDLAAENKISCKEEAVTVLQLEHADEIWITSSTREIYPITKLNQKPVGNGQVGPRWEEMLQLYKKQCLK
ncbi:MAG: aminotransferase class IV [Gammaproteobacteria bacterium]|nr:aminotransferase class IV [Gammaproteobacteria bacterium]